MINIISAFHVLGMLPTIPSASDFNTVLSSDQNTMDTHSQHTHSQQSNSQEDLLEQDEINLCPAAVQLADAQVRTHAAAFLRSLVRVRRRRQSGLMSKHHVQCTSFGFIFVQDIYAPRF